MSVVNNETPEMVAITKYINGSSTDRLIYDLLDTLSYGERAELILTAMEIILCLKPEDKKI